MKIIEAECCPDHIYMLVEIPPHLWESSFLVSWLSCRTVGKYETAIKEYIKNQLNEDIMNDQLSIKEFVDPFTGEQVNKG